MLYKFAPSDVTFANCDRCYYLNKKFGIKYEKPFPGVFSTLDVSQKKYFISMKTEDFVPALPKGRFFTTPSADLKKSRKKEKEEEIQIKNLELPGTIISRTLKDNKSRDFYLIGKPDLVIKFDEKGYGIMDFKTTTEEDKTQGYRFQLEAYAQIFENPGELKSSKTPELSPITHLGLIQFTPKNIYKHDNEMFQQNFKINYSPLIRNKESIEDFFNQSTRLIDILEQVKSPERKPDCKIFSDYERSLIVEGSC
jgi:hypothetical protein